MLSVKGITHDPKTGRWEVRKVIPADVLDRIAIPPDLADGRRGRGEFKRVLMARTSAEAAGEGGAILSRLTDAIRAARAVRPLTSAAVLEAIFTWEGDPPQVPDARDCPVTQPLAHTSVDVDRILNAMVPTMRAQGVDVPADIVSPLQHPALRDAGFEWAEAVLARRKTLVPHGPTITAVMERALAANPHNEARQSRYYVRRLTESLGDLPIKEVTKPMMTDFRVALAQFPVLRSGTDKDSMTFDQILEAYADNDDVPRIIGKTIRTKWCQAYNYVFKFALDQELITRNPVSIPSKKWDGSSGRRAFDQEEIGRMFSHPKFNTSGRNHWLPILALWSGMRMSEIGGVRLADIKTIHGVDVIDLRHRKLKTKGSSRLVPLHGRLETFRSFVDQRKALGDDYLFPDLPRCGDTSAYGKAWGRWMDENGFSDPTTSFHSFRHTFIRACRAASIGEEVHDLFTGHGKAGSVSREYGLDNYGVAVDLPVLSRALDNVDFPTFPTSLIQ